MIWQFILEMVAKWEVMGKVVSQFTLVVGESEWVGNSSGKQGDSDKGLYNFKINTISTMTIRITYLQIKVDYISIPTIFLWVLVQACTSLYKCKRLKVCKQNKLCPIFHKFWFHFAPQAMTSPQDDK